MCLFTLILYTTLYVQRTMYIHNLVRNRVFNLSGKNLVNNLVRNCAVLNRKNALRSAPNIFYRFLLVFWSTPRYVRRIWSVRVFYVEIPIAVFFSFQPATPVGSKTEFTEFNGPTRFNGGTISVQQVCTAQTRVAVSGLFLCGTWIISKRPSPPYPRPTDFPFTASVVSHGVETNVKIFR